LAIFDVTPEARPEEESLLSVGAFDPLWKGNGLYKGIIEEITLRYLDNSTEFPILTWFTSSEESGHLE